MMIELSFETAEAIQFFSSHFLARELQARTAKGFPKAGTWDTVKLLFALNYRNFSASTASLQHLIFCLNIMTFPGRRNFGQKAC
uniref:Uncharacterized protein n=1 Tax=Rhizophora mucronata TaxID=61149 RepID=A0A2P2Q7N5_RHIMU